MTPTLTVEDGISRAEQATAASDRFPSHAAPFDISGIPLLDDKQAGHIRHIQNLADQFPGDWSFMGGPDSWHSGGTLFKQLGALYWPLALAYYHRLPAAPAVFRETSIKLIDKMRRVDVWGYWRDMSASGPKYDETLDGPRESWVDPMVRENIMFSGRLAVMAGLHAMLFDDPRYEQPGGLSLDYPYPYAGGPMEFDYDLRSLNETIFWQIVENGYLGVSCEPNMTFIVCNQYAIIGQRLCDHRYGTDNATDLCRSYQTAWEQKGWLNDSGSLIIFYKPSEDRLFTRNYTTAWDAYALTFMNCWNREMVDALYPRNFEHVFRHGPEGTISIWPEALAEQVRTALAEGKDPANVVNHRSHRFSDSYYDFAFYLPFISEMNDQPLLEGLLAHADRYMQPTWRNGGLYYPRNDVSWDGDGNLIYMDPWCGNGSLAHARLNVKDGLRTIYQHPWGTSHFAEPNLTGIDEETEVLRATFVTDRDALVLTLRSRGDRAKTFMTIANARRSGQPWTLYRGGNRIANGCDRDVTAESGVDIGWDGDRIRVQVTLGGTANFVLQWSTP